MLKNKIFFTAILSRSICVSLFVLFDYIIPDHNANVFNPPLFAFPEKTTLIDDIIIRLFKGASRWDATYFHTIAIYGYVFENMTAFFPLMPLLIRLLAISIFYPVSFCMQPESIMLLSGVVFNNACFVFSAVIFFRLSKLLFGNTQITYVASLVFCFSPASVFFSALYSESLFALMSFLAMYYCEKHNILYTTVFTALSISARSNGLINLGYIGFPFFIWFCDSYLKKFSINSCIVFFMAFYLVICISLAIMPIIVYQWYVYVMYCTSDTPIFLQPNINSTKLIDYGKQNHYGIFSISKMPAWCSNYPPIAYTAIQQDHWDVGFLRYFQLKQVPNFILCLPAVTLCLAGVTQYARHHTGTLLSLGVAPDSKLSRQLIPYVLHTLVLVIYGIFNIHVQVLTRMISSSCPFFYWFIAHLLISDSSDFPPTVTSSQSLSSGYVTSELYRTSNLLLDQLFQFKILSVKRKIIIFYLTFYFVVGILMHVNFLPWT